MWKSATALSIGIAAVGASVIIADAQFTPEYPSFQGMTKQEVVQQIRAQDFVLSDRQIQQVKRFLSTYEVQPEDVRFLKRLAEANGYEYDKIKDTAFVERLKASSTLRVEDAVAVLDREDKTELKKERFYALKSQLPATINRGVYRFRVLDIEKIPKGIAVYFRAFDSENNQIGFGDGTVDIERLQIFHPAVLVEDPTGDIVRTYQDIEDGEVVREWSVTYKEDYVGAIVTDLTLATNNQISRGLESNIERGKIGQTTTTVRPDGGTADGDTDTVLWDFTTSVSPWNTQHDLTSVDSNAPTTANVDSRIRSHFSNNWLSIFRVILGFDTSAVGSDTVSAATLTLTGDGLFQDAFNQDVVIDHATPPSGGGAYAGSDYANSNFDSTDQAPRLDLGSWNTSGTNDFSLNATGLANINGSGDTFFAVRMSGDIDDIEPSYVSNSSSYASFYAADETGTTNDPVLVITHSAGGGGGEEATTTPATIWQGNGVYSGGSVFW